MTDAIRALGWRPIYPPIATRIAGVTEVSSRAA